MKKLLLLILTMSIIFVSKSQVPDTAKLTIQKVYSDVKAGVAGLAQALKVPAEHVYKIIVIQQTTKAISLLIIVLIFLVFSFIGYKITKETYKGHLLLCNIGKDPNYYVDTDIDRTPKGILSVILGAISIVLFSSGIFFFANNFTDIITGFINPEYGALKDIVSFIK